MLWYRQCIFWFGFCLFIVAFDNDLFNSTSCQFNINNKTLCLHIHRLLGQCLDYGNLWCLFVTPLPLHFLLVNYPPPPLVLIFHSSDSPNLQLLLHIILPRCCYLLIAWLLQWVSVDSEFYFDCLKQYHLFFRWVF